jgi:hypothetical protein
MFIDRHQIEYMILAVIQENKKYLLNLINRQDGFTVGSFTNGYYIFTYSIRLG